METARVFVWRVRLLLLALAAGLIGVEADRQAPVSQAIQPSQPRPIVTPLAVLPVKGEPVQVGSGAGPRTLSEPATLQQPRLALAQPPDPRCSGRIKSPDSVGARKGTKGQKSNDCKPAGGSPANIKVEVPGPRKPPVTLTRKHERISAQSLATPPAITVTSDRRPKGPAPS
jgi:hypothetical protein